jgi:hypothetical protein
LHFFELPKLPDVINADDELKLWLALFRAKTEEELMQIEKLGVTVMEQTIKAYRQITATNEFKELERLRSRARHDEATALRHAAEVEREKWQCVVATKDYELLKKDAALTEKDAALTEKDAALTEKDALIAKLQAQLGIVQSESPK